jgi:hypothetical protein
MANAGEVEGEARTTDRECGLDAARAWTLEVASAAAARMMAMRSFIKPPVNLFRRRESPSSSSGTGALERHLAKLQMRVTVCGFDEQNLVCIRRKAVSKE